MRSSYTIQKTVTYFLVKKEIQTDQITQVGWIKNVKIVRHRIIPLNYVGMVFITTSQRLLPKLTYVTQFIKKKVQEEISNFN